MDKIEIILREERINMKIKKLVLGALVLVSVFALAACGSSSNENLQEKVVKKGKLVVAISPDSVSYTHLKRQSSESDGRVRLCS